MEPDDILANHRNYYGSYHSHKETMVYGAATLYVGAATVVILKGRELLDGGRPRCVIVVLLVLSFLLGLTFVVWQLMMREEAARIVRAATTALTRLRGPEQAAPPDMTPTPWRDFELPRVLVDQLNRETVGSAFLGGARTATVLTVLAMLAWSALAVWALVS